MHSKLSRSFVVALISTSLALVTTAPASASGSGDAWTQDGGGGSGGAWTNGGSVGVHASDSDSQGGGSGGGGNGCTYHALSPDEIAIAEDMAAHGIGPAPGDGPGTWYRRICPDGTGVIVWAPHAVDPVALAQQAFDEAAIPLPGIQLNPPADQEQVVNLETWMWVEGWAPVTASATAGAVTVTVTATPTRVDWSMGDGGEVTCDGPGTAYDKSRSPDEQHTDCGYTYRHSSAGQPDGAYIVEATSTWHVTWTRRGPREPAATSVSSPAPAPSQCE